MAEAILKFYSTSADKLDSIPIETGNMIFVQDERTIYLDVGVTRTSYQQIITLPTEESRSALPIPLKGFYFISDTCVFWRYDNGWYQITTTPQEQIIFRPRASFPAEGDGNKIYIDGTKMYRYIDGAYQLLNDSLNWGEFG